MAQGVVPQGPVCAEIFVVRVTPDGALWFAPDGDPWRVDVDPRRDPLDAVRESVTANIGAPAVLHSTSWRHEQERLVLTFLGVVESSAISGEGWIPVRRARLARGEPDGAPEDPRSRQVLEHAMRHLAWLADDDPGIADALPDGWEPVLKAYEAQPFRRLPSAPNLARGGTRATEAATGSTQAKTTP